MRILLVEDNMDLAESIAEFLNMNQCVCDFAFDGQQGLEQAIKNQYDVYIFDIAMPLIDGLNLCKKLRTDYYDQTPVVFLTAKDTLDDKLSGFEAGADDYLVKPFELKELLARINAIHSRKISTINILKIEDLTVDINTETVMRNDIEIILSPKSFEILVALMRRAPELVLRQEIEYLIWGDELPDSDALRSHIYQLRTKIDKPFDRKLIHTIKGRGVRIY